MNNQVSQMKRLNVEKLINDLGGASQVARIARVPRTAPYGWIKRGYIGSPVLERIKDNHPNLDLNFYFESVPANMTNGGQQ